MAKPTFKQPSITGEFSLEVIEVKPVSNGFVVTASYTRTGGKRAGYKVKKFIAATATDALNRTSFLLDGITD